VIVPTNAATAQRQAHGARGVSIPFLAIDVTAILDTSARARARGRADWGSAIAWATAALVPDRVDHLVALSVGHPSASGARARAARKVVVHAPLPVPRHRGDLVVDEQLANFREWSSHPDVDAVIAISSATSR